MEKEIKISKINLVIPNDINLFIFFLRKTFLPFLGVLWIQPQWLAASPTLHELYGRDETGSNGLRDHFLLFVVFVGDHANHVEQIIL